MIGLDRFDFGKSLAKQIEAYKRLSLQAQKRREPNLVKFLDAYTKKYMAVINNPGAANPGLLKNGAEALVEAAEVLQEGKIVYEAFAELVGKSRKVPVVPGLSSLVDRLLEVPTTMTRERVALLNWRITTGNMKPERHLKYLSERATLSGEVADWKDYSWGVSQLLKKEAIKLSDDATVDSLKELLDNKLKLGDRAAQVQMMMAESLLERKNPRQAEGHVIELVKEADLPLENYVELVDRLIDARNETSWELHQIALGPAIQQFLDAKINYQTLSERCARAHKYVEDLANFLIDHPATVKNERISMLTLERILPLDPDKVGQLIERYRAIHEAAGAAPPAEAQQALDRFRSNRSASELRSALGKGSAVEDLLATMTRESVAAPEEDAAPAGSGEPAVSEQIEASAAAEPASAPEAQDEPQAEAVEFEEEPEPLSAAEEEAIEEAAILEEEGFDEAVEAEQIEEEYEEAAAAAEEAPVQAEDEAAPQLQPQAEPEPVTESEPVAEPEIAAEPAVAAQAEAEPAPAETAPAGPELPSIAALLSSSANVKKLISALEDELGDRMLTDNEVQQLVDEISAEGVPDWAALEASLWLAAKVYIDGDPDNSTLILTGLSVHDAQTAERVAKLIHETSDGKPNDDQREMLATLALARGDHETALKETLALPAAWAGRGRLLREISEWLSQQEGSESAMLAARARALREMDGEAEHAFELAASAFFLDPNNKELRSLTESWSTELSPQRAHALRAAAAVRLCSEQGHADLLPLAVEELETISRFDNDALQQEAFGMLEQIRPLVNALEGPRAAETRRRWTRLYLLGMLKSGKKEELPELISSVTAAMEPEESLSLVQEIGEELPASARFTLEYDSLLRRGNWEEALELVAASDAIPVASALPVRMLANHLSAENALPATERLSSIFIKRGDSEGSLELVKEFGEKLVNGGSGKQAKQLRKVLDELLSSLCDEQYEPAVRYRLLSGGNDPLITARDLLALARQGDRESLGGLLSLFPQLLHAGEDPALLRDCASLLAAEHAASDAALAQKILTDAGKAVGDMRWAIARATELGLETDSGIQHYELGRAALQEKNYEMALVEINALMGGHDWSAARELAAELVAEQPESDKAHLALIRVLLSGEQLDARLATSHLLKLAHIYQRRDLSLADALVPLKGEAEEVLSRSTDNIDAQYLRLALAALTGEYQHVTELVDGLAAHDSKALLKLFENFALEDADLPSPLVVAWGRALFKTGRIDDALNRLAGLREAVGDYPEYIALLEEIKSEGGGPGACMQLGEAYLRVHLWQRSAEEYATALDRDGSLAEPIITQLRHHSALDPNPMKYPLHLLGLRAVAASGRQADWGWAISALTWLLPRWNAEELYSLARRLWEQHDRGELLAEQQGELLLHLFRLATRLGRPSDALEYLSHAWEMSGEPTADLVRALGELDRDGLGDNTADWLKLRRYELQAAMQHGDTEKVISVAGELAQISAEGRQHALDALAAYRRQTPEQLPLLLARLKLLDLSSQDGRDLFVSELLAAADADLPTDQARSLIRTVLELIEGSTESPELTKLLLQLFRQMGDEARAWQLAKNHIYGDSDPGPAALDMMQQLASDDFAAYQRIALIEAYIVRREYEKAAELLEKLKPAELGELAEGALALGEVLLGVPGATSARKWLIAAYRAHGRLEQAADHVVWAFAASNPQPAEWLHEQGAAELAFRSAQLHELQGNAEQALKRYEEAHRAKAQNPYIAAAICTRLSLLLERNGQLDKAEALAAEALELLPGRSELKARIAELDFRIKKQRITELASASDSAERTLHIARLYREVGELNEAINELQGGIGRGQTIPSIYIELAECFNESGDFNIARRAFTEVINKLESGDGDAELRLRALYGLATAEERLNNRDEAIRCIEQILVVRHNYLDSRQRLERLYDSRAAAQGSSAQAPAAVPQPAPADKPADAKQEILSDILSLLDIDSDEKDK